LKIKDGTSQACISLGIGQQKMAANGIEPMPAPTRDIPYIDMEHEGFHPSLKGLLA